MDARALADLLDSVRMRARLLRAMRDGVNSWGGEGGRVPVGHGVKVRKVKGAVVRDAPARILADASRMPRGCPKAAFENPQNPRMPGRCACCGCAMPR